VNFLGQKVSALQTFLVLILVLCIGLLSNHLWHGDVLIHTDVARDLLLIREMVETKQLSLIGPRSSVPGIFHGPLWYFISLIPFVIVGGDPVLMGWFWWLIGVASVGIFWFVIQKATKNTTVSLLAAICFALIEIPTSAGPTNTYLANLLAFVPFYFWWQWYKNPSQILSILGWLTIGLLVQFQMAFAVPLALLWLPIFIVKSYKDKQLKNIYTVLFFVLPLATFFLFDLRHDWLQVRSLLTYMQTNSVSNQTFGLKIIERARQAFLAGGNVFHIAPWLNVAALIFFVITVFKSQNKSVKLEWLMLGYIYFGWWIVTLVFSGTIWSFYYDPFITIFLLVISITASHSKHAKLLFFFLCAWLLFKFSGNFSYKVDSFNSSSWVLLSSIAREALSEADTGYFLYSQDQFANPLKYAFTFYQQEHPKINASAYMKKPLTVLVKSADDPQNPWSTSGYWQTDRLGIRTEPDEIIDYPHGYVLEKYHLDQKTMSEPVDPNLVTDLHFR